MSNNLQNLAGYHHWQGKKVRELLASITSDEFNQDHGEPMGSLKDSVMHTVAALETMFILKEKIRDYNPIYDRLYSMDMKGVLARWEELEQLLLGWVKEDLSAQISIPHITEQAFDMDAPDFLNQYILHSVYHRSQIMWILRKLGKETKTLDYIFYYAEDIV